MDLETNFVKEIEVLRKRCLDLQEKSKNDEMRRLVLEVEVENLKKMNKELERKILTIHDVVRDEDEENEGDKFVQLMIENKVLECEKTKAETEVCSWKERVRELTSRVCELESKLSCTNEKVHEDVNVVLKGTKVESCSQVRKRLTFEVDGCNDKKMAPSTPGVWRMPFSGVIDISDEDLDDLSKVKKCSDLSDNDAKSQVIVSAKRKRSTNIVTSDDENSNADEEEDMDGFKVHSLNTRSAKRKRGAKIITSDDDASCDDNAPICTLVKTRPSSRFTTDFDNEVEKNGSKRYLTRLRKSESQNIQDKRGFDVNQTVCLHGNSSSEEDSESEGESLGGFIVDSSDSISEGTSKCVDSFDESEDDYKVTLDKIGRKKVLNMKWDLEGDMLADFGKDPELCMRAVCALYRQQTEDEKASKETIHHNERGFSQPDAFRATKLAEFLTDGDPGGNLNKTVEELKQYDSKGIKLCMKLAAKYSKQLFAIYQNKEDEYFMPP